MNLNVTEAHEMVMHLKLKLYKLRGLRWTTQQQSEKFDELALLNNEIGHIKESVRNTRLREKRSCVTGTA